MIFIDNKYYKWYTKLINSAKARKLLDYYNSELHHIVPKSLGGADTEENLVRLTLREHFICHLLLAKFTNGANKFKMDKAVWILASTNGLKINSRQFADIRKKYRLASVGENNPMYNKRFINDGITEMVISVDDDVPLQCQLGRLPFTEKTKNKMSDHAKERFSVSENNPFFGKSHSKETINKIRDTIGSSRIGSRNGNFKGVTIGTNIFTKEKRYYTSRKDLTSDGFNPAHVSQCILGNMKHHKRWTWTRIQQEQNDDIQ